MTNAQITEPGIYTLPADVYHADPCPEASLSGSVAIPLVHRSPRHAWHAHPRLNPNHQREESSRLDLGSVAHKLVLDAGADVMVIDAADWRTKAAQEARDAAREAGKLPVLAAKFAEANAMAEVAHAFLRDSIGFAPNRGAAEQTLIWQEGSTWCRGMVDWLDDKLDLVIDYKTTASSARPEDAERSLFDLNYHLKAAFYERGLNVLDPGGVGRRQFLFLFQEIEAPFECSLITLSEGAMTIGRKQATYAIRRWQECMRTNSWPGYGHDRFSASPPPWIEKRWLDREMSDPFATGETAPGELMPVYPVFGNAGF